MDTCDVRWDFRTPPYVWLPEESNTQLAQEIEKLGPIERRELAFQLSSVVARKESVLIVNGKRFPLFLETAYKIDSEGNRCSS